MSLSLERDITVWCLHYLLLTMSSSTDSSPLFAASSTNSSPLLETNDTTIESKIKSKYHSTKNNYHALGEYCMVIVWSSCISICLAQCWVIHKIWVYLSHLSCVYFICARCVLCHCDTNELTIISHSFPHHSTIQRTNVNMSYTF